MNSSYQSAFFRLPETERETIRSIHHEDGLAIDNKVENIVHYLTTIGCIKTHQEVVNFLIGPQSNSIPIISVAQKSNTAVQRILSRSLESIPLSTSILWKLGYYKDNCNCHFVKDLAKLTEEELKNLFGLTNNQIIKVTNILAENGIQLGKDYGLEKSYNEE